jgi:hypothetical protein
MDRRPGAPDPGQYDIAALTTTPEQTVTGYSSTTALTVLVLPAADTRTA